MEEVEVWKKEGEEEKVEELEVREREEEEEKRRVGSECGVV